MWLVDRRNVSFQSLGSAPRTSEVLNSPRNSDYFGLEDLIVWSSLVSLPFGHVCILSAIPAHRVQHQLGRASRTAPCCRAWRDALQSPVLFTAGKPAWHSWCGNLSWKSAPFTWPTLSSWTEKFSASLVKDLFSLWKRNHEMWAVRFSKSHSGAFACVKEQTILSASCIIFSVSSCTAVERSRLAVAVSWWASCLHLCAVPAQTHACASPVRLLVKLLVQDAKDPIP